MEFGGGWERKKETFFFHLTYISTEIKSRIRYTLCNTSNLL